MFWYFPIAFGLQDLSRTIERNKNKNACQKNLQIHPTKFQKANFGVIGSSYKAIFATGTARHPVDFIRSSNGPNLKGSLSFWVSPYLGDLVLSK